MSSATITTKEKMMEEYVSPAEQGIIDAEAITEEDRLREWAKSEGVDK